MLHAEGLEKPSRSARSCAVSVAVSPGEVVGLLGPNGGETTTFGMIVGPLRPTPTASSNGGWMSPDVHVPARARSLPAPGARSSGSSPCARTSRILEYQPHSPGDEPPRRRASTSSTSLTSPRAPLISFRRRRRTEIARALITNPVFLLDEPVYRPHRRRRPPGHDTQLKQKGIVLITDHNVRDLDPDRAYIIIEGEVKVDLNPEDHRRPHRPQIHPATASRWPEGRGMANGRKLVSIRSWQDISGMKLADSYTTQTRHTTIVQTTGSAAVCPQRAEGASAGSGETVQLSPIRRADIVSALCTRCVAAGRLRSQPCALSSQNRGMTIVNGRCHTAKVPRSLNQ